MSKKQTRRSISVRGTTYIRLRDWCEDEGVSMSDFVEQRVTEFFLAKPAAARPTGKKVAEKAQKAPLVIEPPAPARVARARVEAPPVRELPSRSAVVKKPMPAAALRASAPAPQPQKPIAAPVLAAPRPTAPPVVAAPRPAASPVVAAVAPRPAASPVVAAVAPRPATSRPASQILKVLKVREDDASDRNVDYRAIRF